MNTERNVILVCGMHRSGTSALARVLNLLGAKLPTNLVEGNPTNPKGHWEPAEIVYLNDRLLADISSSWNDWRAPALEKMRVDEYQYYKNAIKKIILENYGESRNIIIKDPRISRLGKLYIDALKELSLSIKIIIINRNPLSVANSLRTRDGFSIGHGALLWADHILNAEYMSRDLPRSIISFENLLDDWESETRKISRQIKLEWLSADDSAGDQIQNFLERKMEHNRFGIDELWENKLVPEVVKNIALQVRELEQNPCDRSTLDRLDALRSHFNWMSRNCGGALFAELAERERVHVEELAERERVHAEELAERERVHAEELAEQEKISTRAGQLVAQEILDAVHGSFSWQITKPIRGTSTVVRRILKTPMGGAYDLYRKLPIPRAMRERISGYFIKNQYKIYRTMIESSQKSKIRNSLINKKNEKTIYMNDIIVSVIIPVYNRTIEVREAIESILNQTFKNFELIIVLDGSPLATRDIVARFETHPKVRVFSYPTPSGNAVRARNKGILESRGKYIAFLDSDDRAVDTRLEFSVNVFEKNIVDIVYGQWMAIIDGSRKIDGLEDKQIVSSVDCDFNTLKKENVICQSTVMVRKDLFNKIGFIKPIMQYREDHELWLRSSNFGAKFMMIPQVLSELRLHAGNNELNFKENDKHWRSLVSNEYNKKGPKVKKICFVLPGINIGGGVAVVFKHASMLIEAGYDVTIINIGEDVDQTWYSNLRAPIYSFASCFDYILENIDILVATGWQTEEYLDIIDANRKIYFVQSDERRFVEDVELKKKIEEGYNRDIEFMSEAVWITEMLRNEFSKECYYVPNGIDLSLFSTKNRDIGGRKKKRVLLEGPINIPFKGMFDAYAAVKDLDCELWVVSSSGRPPSSWRVDRFFQSVPFGKMAEIYSECDIFLKMSRIEGFFGPPMEAMACGCGVVVGKVTGWNEYIRDGYNALVVEQGDVDAASQAVGKLIENEKLLRQLVNGGLETVQNWTWERSLQSMIDVIGGLYEESSSVVDQVVSNGVSGGMLER